MRWAIAIIAMLAILGLTLPAKQEGVPHSGCLDFHPAVGFAEAFDLCHINGTTPCYRPVGEAACPAR